MKTFKCLIILVFIVVGCTHKNTTKDIEDFSIKAYRVGIAPCGNEPDASILQIIIQNNTSSTKYLWTMACYNLETFMFDVDSVYFSGVPCDNDGRTKITFMPHESDTIYRIVHFVKGFNQYTKHFKIGLLMLKKENVWDLYKFNYNYIKRIKTIWSSPIGWSRSADFKKIQLE